MPPDFMDDGDMRSRLREAFPPDLISKLPRTAKRPELDYVSHAAVTDRLNTVAPGWTYEVVPVTVTTADGMPHVVAVFGSMVVGGVVRQEVGAVDSPSTYGQELKEAISDFIRRGAMRFGVALDMWAKEDLLAAEGAQAEPSPPVATAPAEQPSSPEPNGEPRQRRGGGCQHGHGTKTIVRGDGTSVEVCADCGLVMDPVPTA